MDEEREAPGDRWVEYHFPLRGRVSPYRAKKEVRILHEKAKENGS
nr:MAG TPA: hypothetical protein [Caudoviricetes sp.]